METNATCYDKDCWQFVTHHRFIFKETCHLSRIPQNLSPTRDPASRLEVGEERTWQRFYEMKRNKYRLRLMKSLHEEEQEHDREEQHQDHEADEDEEELSTTKRSNGEPHVIRRSRQWTRNRGR